MKVSSFPFLSVLTIGLTECHSTEDAESVIPESPTESSSHVNVTYNSATSVITTATEQWTDGIIACKNESEKALVESLLSGLRLNFQMSGVTHIELESVDAYGIAGAGDESIITFSAAEGETLQAGTAVPATHRPPRG